MACNDARTTQTAMSQIYAHIYASRNVDVPCFMNSSKEYLTALKFKTPDKEHFRISITFLCHHIQTLKTKTKHV